MSLLHLDLRPLEMEERAHALLRFFSFQFQSAAGIYVLQTVKTIKYPVPLLNTILNVLLTLAIVNELLFPVIDPKQN